MEMTIEQKANLKTFAIAFAATCAAIFVMSRWG